MNILIPINIINNKNIYFHDPIKNTVIYDADFIRILYTDKYIISNGLYIQISTILNSNIIEKLNILEKNILNLYDKEAIHFLKIKELINHNICKCIKNSNNKNFFIIKISGIWKKNNNIGLTLKIIYPLDNYSFFKETPLIPP